MRVDGFTASVQFASCLSPDTELPYLSHTVQVFVIKLSVFDMVHYLSTKPDQSSELMQPNLRRCSPFKLPTMPTDHFGSGTEQT